MHSVRYKLSVYGQPSQEVRPLGWHISTSSNVPVIRSDLESKESMTKRLDEGENDSNEATARIASDVLHVRHYLFRSNLNHHVVFYLH